MPWYDTYGDYKIYYEDGEEPWSKKESTPSLKEYERQVSYWAWCFDMHALLTRFLNWIWERIK